MFLVMLMALLNVNYLLTEAERILVIVPTPSISHQIVFRPLTQELVRRGHEVTVITTDPAFPKGQTPQNLTEVDIHDIAYDIWKKGINENSIKGNREDLFEQVNIFMEMAGEVVENELLAVEVQRVISNKTNYFDLLIIEACVRPALALAHVIKAPLILMSSLAAFPYHYYQAGAPTLPVMLYPMMFRQRLTNLTLWEKLNELYFYYYFEIMQQKQEKNYNALARRLFGPDLPLLSELDKRVEMLFLNVHPIWDFNRPVPPNIVYMGGLHQNPSKELPKGLKSYLDSSKHGVIYISFGTNINPSQLPPNKIQMFLKTFAQLPYDILWKWDKDELPGQSDNIRISKWLPQSDLLRHPNVKLFITQGGLQSTDEAITGGVPLIGMPMLGDQWYNVEQYAYRKIGVRLDMDTLTADKLKTTIETVIQDESYRNNVVKLRAIMRDQPQPPLERAVWWTEHVMRHGGAAHLRSRTANMSWTEYLDLELLTFFLVCALIIVIVICIAVRLLISCVRSLLSNKKKIKTI